MDYSERFFAYIGLVTSVILVLVPWGIGFAVILQGLKDLVR